MTAPDHMLKAVQNLLAKPGASTHESSRLEKPNGFRGGIRADCKTFSFIFK
jgi:hypothetical protein